MRSLFSLRDMNTWNKKSGFARSVFVCPKIFSGLFAALLEAAVSTSKMKRGEVSVGSWHHATSTAPPVSVTANSESL
jgi:hypothetical protein